MGASYFYVNHDKAQYFDCGLFGGNDRFSGIGFGSGARALALLLSARGSWKGDRFSIIADTSDEFDDLVIRAVDISVEAELMLIGVDGLDWLEPELDTNSLAFDKLCRFALLLRRSDVEAILNQKYGAGKWQQRYKTHMQGSTDIWSQKVVDAQNRELTIWQ